MKCFALLLFKTFPKLVKQLSKEYPNIDTSSMKISMKCSTKLENIEIMHLFKVAGALHKPNGILLDA